MDLVNEKNRRSLIKETYFLSLLDNIPHILHAAGYCRKCIKRSLQPVGNNLRKCRLSDTWGAPEDKRRNTSCLDHLPQDGPLAHQMLLADIIV